MNQRKKNNKKLELSTYIKTKTGGKQTHQNNTKSEKEKAETKSQGKRPARILSLAKRHTRLIYPRLRLCTNLHAWAIARVAVQVERHYADLPDAPDRDKTDFPSGFSKAGQRAGTARSANSASGSRGKTATVRGRQRRLGKTATPRGRQRRSRKTTTVGEDNDVGGKEAMIGEDSEGLRKTTVI